MFRFDDEPIKKLIKNGKFSDNSETDDNIKNILDELLNSVVKYNQSLWNNLEDKVLKSDNFNKDIVILSALLPADKKKRKEFQSDFFPLDYEKVIQNSDRNYYIFINEDYGRIREIVGDDSGEENLYKGVYRDKSGEIAGDFKYRFKFSRDYINQQEILFKLRDIYHIENPIIYSPFSHKIFRMEIIDEDISEEYNVDFLLSEKNFSVFLLSDMELFWNLNITKTDYIQCSKIAPYGETLKYKYVFKEPMNKGGIYYIPYNNQTIVFDVFNDENEISIWTDREADCFYRIEYKELKEERYLDLQNKNMLYSNKINSPFYYTKILQSKCDIEYSIRPFRNNKNVTCSICDEKDVKNLFFRYSNKYSVSKFIGIQKFRKVYIRFSTERNLFLCDYVNFVLSFLSFEYPYIDWVGCR